MAEIRFDLQKSQQALLANGNLPKHIAIIMDGNGRWAKSRGLKRIEGHKASIEAVRAIITECAKLPIQALTLYAFSSENWSRPKAEVDGLMFLLKKTIREETPTMLNNNVKLGAIGNLSDLPKDVMDVLTESIQMTSACTGLKLNLALSYGGRLELVAAFQKIAQKVQSGDIQISNINTDLIRSYLYDPSVPDPDLLIRTGGDMRISNFLLWQIAYTELYITPVQWPDFREMFLHQAIAEFQNRERRFGGVMENEKNI